MPSPHYRRAPIREAILDVSFRSEGGTLQALEQLLQERREDFPIVEMYSRRIAEISFDPTEAPHMQASSSPVGWRAESEDKRQIVQLRLDGFTYSILRPYDSWDEFRSVSQQLWTSFRACFNSLDIVRTALRYINEVEFPHQEASGLGMAVEHLRVFPNIPREFGSAPIDQYFMQVVVPQDDIGAVLILNHAVGRNATSRALSLILDIDLYSGRELHIDSSASDDALWDLLEALHERKNRVFESCITDRLRGVIT
jgi:uncharacterized protein (TIGR04255 family)